MNTSRLQRARIALEGLAIGDAFGEHMAFGILDMRRFGKPTRDYPKGTWHYTDDTNMALSIYQILRENGHIDQDKLAQSFAYRFNRNRGYGAGASRLLHLIGAGADWRVESAALFAGTGSYGNGAAMRIPPLGAYFADDYEACVANARKSSEVTHSHPEGVAGGIAVAIAAAKVMRADGDLDVARQDYYATILQYTPQSEVYEKIQAVSEMRQTDPDYIAEKVGNGRAVSAQDTVPFVVWSAFRFMDNYSNAIWHTASVGGDTDTTCAMVGGIVACMVGIENIPPIWRDHTEKLPQWALGEND